VEDQGIGVQFLEMAVDWLWSPPKTPLQVGGLEVAATQG